MKTTARRALAAAAMTGAAFAAASGAANAASFSPADVHASGIDTSLPVEQLPAHEVVSQVQDGAAWTVVGLMFGEDVKSLAGA